MKPFSLAAIITLLVLAGVLLMPFEVTLDFDVPGKVLPQHEWTLVRNQEGAISSMLRNNTHGTVDRYAFNRFERGDAVRLQIRPSVVPHSKIEMGDTLASFLSAETDRQMAQLSGEFSAALASLDLFSTGEKPSTINEAEMQLEAAQERAAQNEKIILRLRVLRERDLISEQELEIAESQQRVLHTDVATAQARLDVVRTGAKPQQLALTRTEAAALEAEIAALNQRINLFTITSPIDGTVVRTYSSDTLLQVVDTSFLSVVMPIPWDAHSDLTIGQSVDIVFPGAKDVIQGEITQLGDSVHQLNGQQVFLVTASIQNDHNIPIGMLANCKIEQGRVLLREYVVQSIQTMFR